MRRYFNAKAAETKAKEAIVAQINQVAQNHAHHIGVSFYSKSFAIYDEHFNTEIYADGTTRMDKLCSGNIPESLEDKIAAVTKMHEYEQQHKIVMAAILKVLS